MRFLLRLSLLLTLAAVLAGCALPLTVRATPTPGPSPTASPRPGATATPTPALPLAILVIPADLDPELSSVYQQLVYDLAHGSGWRFQVLNTLTVPELEPTLRVAVFVRTDPGISALAAAAPWAQFVAIEVPGITPGGNLSIVADATAGRPDLPAFIGGYIAGMLATDYKAGIILAKGREHTARMYRGFYNGMTYYCGTCNPFYGPFLDYPLAVEIPADAKVSEYDSYANFLIGNKVDMMYLDPAIAEPELLRYLNGTGVWMIGPFTPAGEYNSWVASLMPDYPAALRAAWPELELGRGGVTFRAQLTLTNVNSNLLTDGKRALAQQVLDQLLAGLIATGAEP